LVLDRGKAEADARQSVATWLKQLGDQKINFPGFKPNFSPEVSVNFPDGKSITVTVRRCYKPFLFNGVDIFPGPRLFGAPGSDCPNGILVVAHYTASPLAGL
jgi:hypothetical protein